MDSTPAFPLNELSHDKRLIVDQHFGMTLRDYFAAKALQGLLADHQICATDKEFAKAAYEQADAMMAARGQQ